MFYRRFCPILLLIPLLLVFLLCFSGVLNAAAGNTELSEAGYKEDINGDGKQNITDVIALLLLGRDNPSDLRADYDGNGSYAVNDAIALLLNIMSGNLTPLEQETHSPGDIVNIQGILNMAYIPEGDYLMGGEDGDADEKPIHRIYLDAFWMSVTEITQEQYENLTGTNPSYWKDKPTNPVENVSWYDAVTFCNKLSELAGFEPCYDLINWKCDFSKNGFRLPTEAEWEYACRAGTSAKYYSGEEEIDLDIAGWHYANSGGDQQPVAEKMPNRWKLYDMHGNVWEWCNDRYDENYYSNSPNHNPTGPESGSYRVLRSGCACADAYYHRSANREYDRPTSKGQTMGIRIVRHP